MKAIVMTGAGGADVLKLRDLPDPQINAAHEVKVRLCAAGINPIDTKLRSRGLFFPDALPAILGCDGAGEVVECGTGVTRLRPGDPVWFCHGGLGNEPGNYAEYALVPESVARIRPGRLSCEQAAAAPLVLLTAWEALYDRARLTAGQTVLIHAGAGGVGHVAIQLAKLRGARVITTVGSPEKARFVSSLGADQTILYRETDFVETIMDWTGGRGVDVVLDSVGGETFRRSLEAAALYGDVVTLLDPGTEVSWKSARSRNLRIGFELMLTPMLEDRPEARAHQSEILDQCADLFNQGKLRLELTRTLPLEQAAEAHREIESGHVQGKLALAIR
jgi:NADPH2:quinone reductase